MLNEFNRLLMTIWAMARQGFATYMAYPAGVAMVFLSYPIVIMVNRFLFNAIYDDGGTIAGYNTGGILTYITISWILNTLYMTPTGRALGGVVRDGQVAMEMLKPVNLMTMYFGQALGRTAFRAMFASLPLLLLFAVFGAVQPPAPGSIPILIPAIICGYMINFLLDYMIGLLAFYFEYNNGLRQAIRTIMNLVGGLVIPLNYFPDSVAYVFSALPTQYMFYQPLQVYLGRLDPIEAWPRVAYGFIWVIVLCVAAQLMQRDGSKRLAISGG